MYNLKNNEDLTNDEHYVCEDVAIPAHERAIIDKTIMTYAPLMDKPECWTPWEIVKEHIRRFIDEI